MVKYRLMGIYCNRGRIVTMGDGTTSDVIQNYVENQGNQEEKSV
jgi:putative transposase